MSLNLHSLDVDELFNAILSLKNIDECYKFFEDLATIGEILSMAQRLQIAKRLITKTTCLEICEELGASTATISRVKRYLEYGSGGYGMILVRLGEKNIGK